ncbi:hypothetical protein BDZ89DRAFT_1168346 [Hymenopellis radicata]|nr:hypothetical protein BDZ89DRAFT_1168346 [Hymenopellis radicata]
MSSIASSSVTDIAQSLCHLVNTLNGQYPLRRAEIELFPTAFCQDLIQETARSSSRCKAPATMPRSSFDSLLEAAAQCIGRDTSSSTLTFGGLALNDFQLDRAYPFCLFQNGKVVVPHDTVFLVLHHLRAYSISLQLDLKPLVYGTCTFITTKVVNRFLSIVSQAPAASLSVPQPITAAPPIRMSSFGLNISVAPSFIRQRLDSITAKSKMLEPSTPRASRYRMPTSPTAYDPAHSSQSPLSPTLTKRLFQDDIASIRRHKKSRGLKDSNQGQQSGQLGSDRRRQRANRSVGKRNQERAQVQSDDMPQTSPISKLMPGSIYSRGERVEGGRRKRTVRDKENVPLKKGL